MWSVERLVHPMPKAARIAAYFGLQRLIGSRIGPIWREFLEWERLPADALEKRVDDRLGAQLAAAVQNCGFYRDLKIAPRGGESAARFLKRFPIIDRGTLRERFRDLLSDALRPRVASPEAPAPKGFDWLIVKTGGTTGEPTTVLHDAPFRDWGRATRLYALKMSGFPLGTPYFRLWGSEQDLRNERENFNRRLLRALHGETAMNAFRAREQDLRGHYDTIVSRPGVRNLMAYVDAASSLARFIEDRGLPPPKLSNIMACAGTVTDESRKLLERVFGAQVFDKYGSRECADMASECAEHSGLHIYSPHAFLEVVDEQGRECPPGELGRLLVTVLTNKGFPLIRYDIGDLAVRAQPGPCACGSPFPRLQSLQGRPDDMLTTEEGTLLTSVFVRHFVGVSLNKQLIGEWQLEQLERGEFVFRYIAPESDALNENLRELEESFREAFGRGASIRFQAVREIPKTPSGKTRWIVNRLQNKEPAAVPAAGSRPSRSL